MATNDKNLSPQLIEFKKYSKSFRDHIIPPRSPTFKKCFKAFLSNPQMTDSERQMYAKIEYDKVYYFSFPSEFLLNLEMSIHSLFKSDHPVSDHLSFFVREYGKYLPTLIQVFRCIVVYVSNMKRQKPDCYDWITQVIKLYDDYCSSSNSNQMEDTSSSSSSSEIGKNPNEGSETTNIPDWFKSEFMKNPKHTINITSREQLMFLMAMMQSSKE